MTKPKSPKSPKSLKRKKTFVTHSKTLYESLSGKKIPKSTSYDSVLEMANDELTQKAVLGLIFFYAGDHGIKVSMKSLPYGMKFSSPTKVFIIGDNIPKELMEKIYQLLTKT